jgi:hypothetical protein
LLIDLSYEMCFIAYFFVLLNLNYWSAKASPDL